MIDIDENESHTAQLAYSFFVQEFFVESTTFSKPLFVCTDNAVTMKAAFEGWFDTDTEIIRSGCTEHTLVNSPDFVGRLPISRISTDHTDLNKKSPNIRI